MSVQNSATTKMIQNVINGTTPPQQTVKATQDGDGNIISSTYAKQSGTYPNITAGNATHAASADTATNATNATHATTADSATTAANATNATKATQDGNGNNIVDTYATKTELSNPNLLINPDFKINQRGKTTYTGNTYTVDRWVNESGSQASVNVVSTGLRLNSTTSTPLYLYQYIEQDLELSTNYVLTLSGALTESGTRAKYSAGFTTPSTKPTSNTVMLSQTISPAHVTISVGYNTTKGYYVRINVLNDAANTLYLDWVKLEKGSVSTMFVPPDTASELLKCQRYYQVIKRSWFPCSGAGTGNQFSVSIGLIPQMRTAPTLESASTGGWIRFGGSTKNVTTSGFTLSDNSADKCRLVGSVSPAITGFGSDIGFISSFDIELDAEI